MKLQQNRTMVLAICFALSFSTSCRRISETKGWWIDKLEYPVENYEGDLIGFNGFYWRINEDSSDVKIIYFYKNGIIQNASFYDIANFSDLDSLVYNYDWYINKKIRCTWGAYRLIDEFNIEIQQWYPLDLYDRLFISSGIILNDSQFVLNISRQNNSYFFNDVQVENINEIFTFRQLDFKPDSVNKFIEIDN